MGIQAAGSGLHGVCGFSGPGGVRRRETGPVRGRDLCRRSDTPTAPQLHGSRETPGETHFVPTDREGAALEGARAPGYREFSRPLRTLSERRRGHQRAAGTVQRVRTLQNGRVVDDF